MARRPFAVDTSIVVASLLSWHEHHGPALAALEAESSTRPLFLPVPVLVEAYAVMTRLPAPHRLAPPDAHALLRGSFASAAHVGGLSAEDCWPLLEELARRGVAGGRTYDAQIVAAAVKASADVLLTLNLRDFAAIAPGGLEVRSPVPS